jgi:hypothetical protein
MLKRLDYFWFHLEGNVMPMTKDSINNGESSFYCSE